MDVGLEVSNHVKFSVCFYLYFYAFIYGCASTGRYYFLSVWFPYDHSVIF